MSEIDKIRTSPESMREAVIIMAVESWRFGRVFDLLLTKLDAREQRQFKSEVQ
jgi:hypothetical protein